MTDAPLSPEVVDELLSAELDGEFDAAARDLGLDPVAARAQLDARPGIAERRAALAQASGALAVPPLSDTVREHLVRVAIDAGPKDELAGRRNRRRQVFTVGGSIAAAVLVVVGAVAVFNSDDTDTGDMSVTVAGDASDSYTETTTGAATLSPTAGGSTSLDFGAIADEDQLRTRVQQNRASAADEDTANEDLAGGDSGRDAGGEQESSLSEAPPLASSRPDRAAYDAATNVCLTTLAPLADGTLTLAGTATYAGQAAYVFVFERPSGPEIVVTKTDDCTRLVTIPLDR